MKNLKKLASLLLVLVMVFALAAPAMATDVTINIETPEGSSEKGETYTVYKIFDATVNGELKDQNGTDPDGTVSTFANVSYTISSGSPFYSTIETFTVKVGPEGNQTDEFAFKLTRINDSENYVVEMVHEYNAADLADALKAIITDTTPKAYQGGSPLKLDNNNGYYLILSSLGSKAVVDTVGQNNMTIKTKNDLPTLTKKITDVDNGKLNDPDTNGVADSATASYGSTVTFDIDVFIPASAVGAITVHDEMDNKLTYVGLVAGGPATEMTADKTAPAGFTHRDFVISAETVAAHLNETVKIQYTATVNAGVDTNVPMTNSAYLTYSEYTTPTDEVNVKTYEFDLVKTTSDNNEEHEYKLLDGAKFKLFTDETNKTALKFTFADGVYSVDPNGTDTIAVTGGKVTIKGLSGANYYLKETEAPTGYNAIDDSQVIALNGNNGATVDLIKGTYTSGGVQVINLTGTELPSTGGIGTTLFYIVGGLLIVGAAVLLITKKRVNGEQ